ncbi:hypothetical protein D3C78_1693870 [compost metagenome]
MAGHQGFADIRLFTVIRGSVDRQQDLCSRRFRRIDRFREPQVFADQQPQAIALQLHHAVFIARIEIALLIEYAVVRQLLLEVTSLQSPLREQ